MYIFEHGELVGFVPNVLWRMDHHKTNKQTNQMDTLGSKVTAHDVSSDCCNKLIQKVINKMNLCSPIAFKFVLQKSV